MTKKPPLKPEVIIGIADNGRIKELESKKLSIHFQNDDFPLCYCFAKDRLIIISTEDYLQIKAILPDRFKGGMLILSHDLSMIPTPKGSVTARIKACFTDIYRGTLKELSGELDISEHEDALQKIFSFSLGCYLKKPHTTSDGILFSEDSICVEVQGVDEDLLRNLAGLVGRVLM